MRVTRRVFHDLALWMIALGLGIGVSFPFFVVLLGVPSETAWTATFFLACLGAGALAGGTNFALARWVVGTRIRLLAQRMSHVEENLLAATAEGDAPPCSPQECHITVDSNDEIGESATAFNRLVDALSRSIETQAALRAFSELLTSQLELDTLAEKALRQFLEHTGAEAGAVLYESGGDLHLASSHGLREPGDLVSNDHVRTAVRTGDSQVIRMPEGVRVDGVLAEFRPSEVFVLPATYKEIPLGVVVLATSGSFDGEARARMELFRRSFGLALNNAITHGRLQRLAALDPLTGVYNRRFGMTRLHEEFDRAVRMNAPLGVLMFDLDHFKQVNDTYGHLVGDRVLVTVAGIAKSVLRDGDVLIRYGGEEFLAVLPAASSEDVRQIAERLRHAVEEAAIADGPRSVRTTISLGGSSYPNHNVQKDSDLVHLADEALFRAKDAGRNRLVLSR
ncbi:MAG: diguanylate cyclase [Candidatus Bipolaricaulota bacterium]